PRYTKQQQDITEKKIVDQKSHVSHEPAELQIDGGVKRGILILKYVLNKLTIPILIHRENRLTPKIS
ncbi:MAG: hypothetical protein RRZ65_02790, partial [Tannerellaceae bacterium]